MQNRSNAGSQFALISANANVPGQQQLPAVPSPTTATSSNQVFPIQATQQGQLEQILTCFNQLKQTVQETAAAVADVKAALKDQHQLLVMLIPELDTNMPTELPADVCWGTILLRDLRSNGETLIKVRPGYERWL